MCGSIGRRWAERNVKGNLICGLFFVLTSWRRELKLTSKKGYCFAGYAVSHFGASVYGFSCDHWCIEFECMLFPKVFSGLP